MNEENDILTNDISIDITLDKEKVESSIQSLSSMEAYFRDSAVQYLSSLGEAIIPYLMKAMDNHTRIGGAIETLVKMGETGVAPLIACLNSKNGMQRTYAAQALGYIGKPLATEAVPLLIKMLDDWYVPARINCAHALGILGDKDTVAPLKERLPQEQDYPVHNEIVLALKKIG